MGPLLLLGMMASGKSTIGRVAAALLGWPYLDNDTLVQAARGTALAELAAREGEAGLRRAEQRAVASGLAAGPRAVVAVAGGAVLDPRVVAVLRAGAARGAVLAWIRVPVETLADRVRADEAAGRPPRPWLAPDPLARLRELAAEREPRFAELATVTVDGDGPVLPVAQRLVAEVRRPAPVSARAAGSRPGR